MSSSGWKDDIARLGAAFGCALLLFSALIRLGAFPLAGELRDLRPSPDVEEYAWVALRFAEGKSPLMPIANELHPSRYAPVHPFLISIWLRIGGGGLDGLYAWPVVALVLSLLFFNAAMIRYGLSLLSCVLFSWLFLLNASGYGPFSTIMSECSMIMLTAVALFGWAEAERYGRDGKRALCLTAAFLCGAAVAGVVCMRITMAFLGFAFIIHALLLRGREAWPPLIAYIIGGAFVALSCAVYTHSVSGYWSASAYGYWIHLPASHFLSLVHGFTPVLLEKGQEEQWQHALRGLAGLNDFAWHLAVPTLSVLLGGMVGAAIVLKKHADAPLARLSLLLTLAGLAIFVVHVFYRYPYPRFVYPITPLLILAGIACWEHLLRTVAPSRMQAAFMIPCLAFLLAWPPALQTPLERSARTKQELDHAWYVARAAANHEEAGLTARASKCPIFVDQLSVMRARIFLGMEDSPMPIATLRRHNEHHLDSHTIQFLWFPTITEGSEYLEGQDWPRPPEAYMWEWETDTMNDKFLKQIIATHGRFLFYFPEWSMPVGGIFGWCEENGYTHQVIAAPGPWRLVLVQPQPTG